ncbi:hypothetical protein [Acinetobacter nosocomialis]|uniref:hypothetical protein n=1 Tax=Acinetobacter nosocomialis TaxID=106654 RepID=UPI0023AF88CD|nr:hypothetical protein [Acinetobacter nosocomialis]MDE9415776.1 hypothetical protein [Acinetobacter nosocomialis]
MTDLNKLRSEFESDLADHLIERDANGFYINDEIQNYWEKHLLKAQIKELKAELEKAKAQAVPEKKIYLTCEQLYAAANFGAPNKDPELLETELTIAWFDEAHSGSGYYVYISEYPEEGAMKLESESGAEK